NGFWTSVRLRRLLQLQQVKRAVIRYSRRSRRLTIGLVGLGCSGDSTGSNPDPNMHTRIAWCKMKEVVTMAARPRSSFGAASAPATRASPVSIRKARQDYVATATEQTIDTADHS